MMKDQLTGRVDSWAVWWGYAIAERNGFCLNPVRSKIRNIGHDETGTHSGETDKFEVALDETPMKTMAFPDEPFIHEEIHDQYIKFVGGGRWYRVRRHLADLLKDVGLWDVYRSVRD
jgi:hypothetical protein